MPGHAGARNRGSSERATCFIVASAFDRWRERHRGWRVIENADENYRGAPMIGEWKVESRWASRHERD